MDLAVPSSPGGVVGDGSGPEAHPPEPRGPRRSRSHDGLLPPVEPSSGQSVDQGQRSLLKWASMDWAVAVEGRTDPGGILVLLGTRSEAEIMAIELRRRGQRVAVRRHFQPDRRNGSTILPNGED